MNWVQISIVRREQVSFQPSKRAWFFGEIKKRNSRRSSANSRHLQDDNERFPHLKAQVEPLLRSAYSVAVIGLCTSIENKVHEVRYEADAKCRSANMIERWNLRAFSSNPIHNLIFAGILYIERFLTCPSDEIPNAERLNCKSWRSSVPGTD
jgi:hypothetical protein